MTTSLTLTPSIYKVTNWEYCTLAIPGHEFALSDNPEPEPTHIRVQCVKIMTSGSSTLTPIIGRTPVTVYFDIYNSWCNFIIQSMNDDKPIYIMASFDDIRSTEEYQMMHPFGQ
jgi:hypothetical protein